MHIVIPSGASRKFVQNTRIAKRSSARSTELYFNLKFAGRLGTERYIRISRYHPPYDQIGGWIFSAALFGDDAEATQRYIDELLKGRTTAFREGHYTNRP